MSKTEEALQRLGALENEAAALRRIIEAPEPVEKKPLVQAKDKKGYPVFHSKAGYYGSGALYDGHSFETEDQAQSYAEAFNTLLDLRRQPGSEAAVHEIDQWGIDGSGKVFSVGALYRKVELLCPMFATEEAAEAARDAVGLKRILSMYHTLHGRGYE